MAIRELQRQNGIVYQAYFKLNGVQYNKICYTKNEAREWEAATKIDLRQQRSPEQSMMYLRASDGWQHIQRKEAAFAGVFRLSW